MMTQASQSPKNLEPFIRVRKSLEWRGFKVWGESLEGLPFTAHPKVESDGTL